jgi:SAM-dependent methyltransferase
MSKQMSKWLSRYGRRAVGGGDSELFEAHRRLVLDLAPGKSFVDLGGMYGIHGLIAFLAEEAGAESVALFDGMDPSPEFVAEHEKRGSKVRYTQGDLHDPVAVAELGRFDVVWCAGVIYHSPNPYLLIEHLRLITRETLMLATHIVPEIPGFPSACIWYPGLPEEARRTFADAHGGRADSLWGASTEFDRTEALGYANFWWGITPSALRGMLDVANFEVLEERLPDPFIADVLARPVDRPSVIPGPEFARERGKKRLEEFAEPRPPWA